MNKKAQGLPLNLIILAIIAALVLVLVLAFTIGGAGTIFAKIFKTGTTAVGEDLDVVRTTCQSLCDQAQITDASQQPGSNYCQKTFDVDIDQDGSLGDTDETKELGLKCSDTEIGTTCDVTCETG